MQLSDDGGRPTAATAVGRPTMPWCYVCSTPGAFWVQYVPLYWDILSESKCKYQQSLKQADVFPQTKLLHNHYSKALINMRVQYTYTKFLYSFKVTRHVSNSINIYQVSTMQWYWVLNWLRSQKPLVVRTFVIFTLSTPGICLRLNDRWYCASKTSKSLIAIMVILWYLIQVELTQRWPGKNGWLTESEIWSPFWRNVPHWLHRNLSTSK